MSSGARLLASGIPRRFWDRTLDTYQATTDDQKLALKWAQNFLSTYTASAQSSILLGRTGTGKTHLVCGVARAILDETEPLRSDYTGELFEKVRYTSVQSMVRAVKDSWTNRTRNESQVRAMFTAPRVLIVDEVGMQFGTDFEANYLFDVFNARYEEMKPTVLVSNLPLSEVSGLLGERVIDRFREDGGQVLSFDWKSHRSGGENHG